MKAALRKQIIALRRAVPTDERARASHAITLSVCSLPEWKAARVISVYRALPTEIDTTELIERAGKEGKIVLYPDSHTGAQLYIVPGVAFDREGNRVGRGRGYYDRLLAGLSVPKIGLAYELQVIDKVPRTSYDVSMTMVVTQKTIYGKAKTP